MSEEVLNAFLERSKHNQSAGKDHQKTANTLSLQIQKKLYLNSKSDLNTIRHCSDKEVRDIALGCVEIGGNQLTIDELTGDESCNQLVR